MNSFVYCTFLFCFLKIMIVRRFLNILDQHFCIAWTNWMNFKGMYYVVLLYDIMLRSWPPYPNLESEFLCHFPGPPNDNLFSTILYIQHPAHFPGQKRSIFSCWFQLAFCSVQLALGEFEQSSKDLFYVPYPREVCIFYHIWVGAKNLWNMIERNSYR